MNSHSFLRPLIVMAASASMMGSALADTFGNFTYTSNGTAVTITGHANVATPNLVIPDQINGVPVRAISILNTGGAASSLGTSVTSITIPDSVTTIAPLAFRDFVTVTSITIPNSVTDIGGSAFVNCRSLTSATIGNGVTSLESTFRGCISLVSVDLPDNLVSLSTTFWGCTSLAQIQIPESVTSIQNAFKECTGLKSVVLPAGMTVVSPAAFLGCTSLREVTLPSGLLTIGFSAFASCTSLESIVLPSSLQTINSQAFMGCSGLKSINFPSSLKTIESQAFSNCTSLTSVVLPPALNEIGNAAFDGCISLASLTVPDTLTIIGDNAFWRCPALTEINLPVKFLSSLSNLGFDYKPEIASNALVSGIANSLANSPSFVSKLADTIIAKNGHYGLATQSNITAVAGDITAVENDVTTVANDITAAKSDITAVANGMPQAVRDVLAEIGVEAPVATGITSDLGTLTVKKGKPLAYTITTSFSASAFFATGLPDGVIIDAATGAISGKPKKPGTYMVLLQAGNPGGGTVGAVKTITVTP